MIVRLAALVFFSLTSVLAFAQPLTTPPDAGRILQETREPFRLPPPSPDLAPRPPEPKPALGNQPKLRVKVAGFTFTGNTLLPEGELKDKVQEFVGKDLNFEGLNDAATEVRAYYRSRGYFLAQAYLPEQTIRNGIVEITIIEGRWGIIELDKKPATRISTRLLAGILGAHLHEGGIITETGLERPLLLINDLPDATVTTELRPSETVGAANLRVNVDPGAGPITGFVDSDNHGNRFTGEYRFGFNLNWNQPAEWGDRLTVRGFTTDEHMWYGRIAYDLPVGYWGTRIGASYSKFDYALGKDFAALLANGEGEVTTVYGSHSIVRTRNTNLLLNFGTENKKLVDRIQSTSPTTTTEQNIYTYKLGLVGDFRDGALGGGLNAYGISYIWGNLGTTAAAAGADTRNTQGNFNKWNVDLRRQQRLTDDASVLLSVSGQIASKNLASAEKISLGGPNGVRAYPVGEATADSGLVSQTELRYIIPGTKILGGDLTFLSFFDYGYARINQIPAKDPTTGVITDSENVRSFSGYGLGGQLGKEGDFLLRATASWSHTYNEKPQSDTARRVPRVWMQAIKWF
ncbi:MAG TPA: ShlB/FhaC/HecB family hemolysin secretion/activation protein [Burkholderiales bacterium]|nr:ShlB/FhaC/HecB family hemolysin secretion/activation protein [Burkholderiales bacterium]